VALAAALQVAEARRLLLDLAVGELAVVAVLGHVEPEVPAGRVGETVFDQPFAHLDDLADVLGGLGEPVDGVDAEGREALEILLRVPLGQLGNARLEPVGGVDELVVHVRDVDHPRHLEALVDEVALDRVEDDRPDHVPDVRRLVDRRTAQVHPHLAGAHGLEQLFLLAEGVVDAEAHGWV
jgi:hypothetical protein